MTTERTTVVSDDFVGEQVRLIELNAITRYRIVLHAQVRALPTYGWADRRLRSAVLSLIGTTTPSERPEEVTPTSDLSPAAAARRSTTPQGEPAR